MNAPLLLVASGTLAIISAVWIASNRIAEAMNDRSDGTAWGDCWPVVDDVEAPHNGGLLTDV